MLYNDAFVLTVNRITGMPPAPRLIMLEMVIYL